MIRVILGSRIFWWIKLLITLSLLALVFYKVNWSDIFSELKHVRTGYVVLVFFLILAGVFISAVKWVVLLAPFSVRLKVLFAFRLYLITFFFNNFLPGSIGGDGYRIFRIYKLWGKKSIAFIPVFVERFSGFGVLMLVGGLAGAYHFSRFGDQVSAVSALLGIGFIFTAGTFILLLKSDVSIPKLEHFKLYRSVSGIIDKLSSKLLLYSNCPKALIWAVIISALFYSILILSRYILFASLGVEVSIVTLLIVLMLSNSLAMLPVSINGYGVLDISFIQLMTHFGTEYEQATLVMVLHRVLLVLVSLCGGVAYAFSHEKTPERISSD